MDVEIPDRLRRRLAEFDRLSRWERSELGREFRALGLSYGEIQQWMDVPKSTLSVWCRGIDLTPEQKQGIFLRTGSQKGIPRDTQRRRRAEIRQIRESAQSDVASLCGEPLWVAGTVLYWGEGDKASNGLGLSNSDEHTHRLFIKWVRWYVDEKAEFVLKLNLHSDNDEVAAKRHWEHALGLENVRFYRTFIKQKGTGHKKNTLKFGVCQTRVRASTDGFHRVMGWIDGIKADTRFF